MSYFLDHFWMPTCWQLCYFDQINFFKWGQLIRILMIHGWIWWLSRVFIRQSTFCQKVTVHKDQKSSYASKQDVLVLVTLRYNKEEIPREKRRIQLVSQKIWKDWMHKSNPFLQNFWDFGTTSYCNHVGAQQSTLLKASQSRPAQSYHDSSLFKKVPFSESTGGEK